jgi:hypothetical protein
LSDARTIDDVVARLDDVIAESRRAQSRLGYFAALYRGVTVRVKEGIASGRFEDGARMERLDVIFANRYLDALASYRRGGPTSRCWQRSFRAADNWFPLVLQHLLLGINAHINLDLGIAAAETSPGDDLGGLRRDFDGINDILCSMLEEVQDRLALVSGWMTLLDRAGCRADEAVMNFSINRAREKAWKSAQRLASVKDAERQGEIDALDGHAAFRAQLIQYPGLTLRAASVLVRVTELRDVSRLIDVLS